MKKKIMLMVAFLFLVGAASFAQTTTPVVKERQENQQERIGQGVSSGELTPRETMRLENQQERIQENKIEAKSDGVVTAKERRKLKRQQKRASKNIYRQKHDGQDLN